MLNRHIIWFPRLEFEEHWLVMDGNLSEGKLLHSLDIFRNQIAFTPQHLFVTMASQPLLQTIEADDPTERSSSNAQQQKKNNMTPVVLTPTTNTASSGQTATAESDAESGKYFHILNNGYCLNCPHRHCRSI